MRKILLLGCMTLGLVSPMLCNAETAFVLTEEDAYGNSMGTTEACTGRTFLFYDANNLLMRKVTTAPASDDSWYPSYLYYWNRDAEGQLIDSYYYQYQKAYERWSAVKDSTVYAYDGSGHMLSATNKSEQTRYEWDGDNLVVESIWRKNAGEDTLSMQSSKTYSDFLSGVANKPQRMDAWGKYSSSIYDEHYTYDENYRLTDAVGYKIDGTKKSRTSYAYDVDGICLEKVVYTVSADTFKYSTKEVRTSLGDGQYQVNAFTWGASSGKWNGKASWTVE